MLACREIDIGIEFAIERANFFVGINVEDIHILHILFFEVIVFHNDGHPIFQMRTTTFSKLVILWRIIIIAQRELKFKGFLQAEDIKFDEAYLDSKLCRNRNFCRVADFAGMARFRGCGTRFFCRGLDGCLQHDLCGQIQIQNRIQNTNARFQIQTNGNRTFRSDTNLCVRRFRTICKCLVCAIVLKTKAYTCCKLRRALHFCNNFDRWFHEKCDAGAWQIIAVSNFLFDRLFRRDRKASCNGTAQII